MGDLAMQLVRANLSLTWDLATFIAFLILKLLLSIRRIAMVLVHIYKTYIRIFFWSGTYIRI